MRSEKANSTSKDAQGGLIARALSAMSACDTLVTPTVDRTTARHLLASMRATKAIWRHLDWAFSTAVLGVPASLTVGSAHLVVSIHRMVSSTETPRAPFLPLSLFSPRLVVSTYLETLNNLPTHEHAAGQGTHGHTRDDGILFQPSDRTKPIVNKQFLECTAHYTRNGNVHLARRMLPLSLRNSTIGCSTDTGWEKLPLSQQILPEEKQADES